MAACGEGRMSVVGVYFMVILYVSCILVTCEDSQKKEDAWKKKDVRDYTDADIERLFEQWEDADEPLEDDELPEWKRPEPKIDLSQLDPNDPEGMLKMSKKGRTLMMFATVSGNPTEKETESVTQLWQSSLFNANIEVQRYVVGSNRVLFMLKDGGKAWEIKDFLVNQDRCELVTIEGKDYFGKGHTQANDDNSTKKNSKEEKKKKKKKKNANENEIKKNKVVTDTEKDEL